jgi:hypothetical protein
MIKSQNPVPLLSNIQGDKAATLSEISAKVLNGR